MGLWAWAMEGGFIWWSFCFARAIGPGAVVAGVRVVCKPARLNGDFADGGVFFYRGIMLRCDAWRAVRLGFTKRTTIYGYLL